MQSNVLITRHLKGEEIMIYIEITCNDCGADVGYGKAIGSDKESLGNCPHCGSGDLFETTYYDD